MTRMKNLVRKGDKVILSCTDWNKQGYKDKNSVIAEIVDVTDSEKIIYIRPEDNGLDPSRHSTYQGEMVERSLMAILCDECEQEKLYHNGEEEYFCPWCDL